MPSLAFHRVPLGLRAGIGTALALALAALVFAPAAQAGKRPNILMVTTDDQTLAQMDERFLPVTSDFFEARGTEFEGAVTVSPSCCPSRAAFLSGEYPHNNGVLSNDPGYSNLQQRRNTLPAWLQAAGYRTAHFGKFLNHFGRVHKAGEPPPGWDRWYTLINYRYFNYRIANDGKIRKYGDRDRDYVTRRITDATTKYIRKYRGKKPFYLQLDHFAPHSEQASTPGRCTDAAQPDPLDADLFIDEPLPQESLPAEERSFNEIDVSDKSPAIERRRHLSDFVVNKIKTRYRCQLAALAGVDRSFGRVIEALTKRGKLRNTAIFFTSDNGFFHGEHRLPNNKGLPYEEGVRVPMLASLPKRLIGGDPVGPIPQPVGNIDLAPTLLDLAKAEPCPENGRCRRLDGRSLMPLLQGRSGSWPEDRHIVIEQGRVQYFCFPYSSIWSPSELYAQFPTATGEGNCSIETEHYELGSDPMQLENLYPAEPETELDARQQELATTLAELRRCSGIRGREKQLPDRPFCE